MPDRRVARRIRRPTLVLQPEVARQVRALAERIEEVMDPYLVHLGGGSVLAARYGHRRSTDIDLWIPERLSGLVDNAVRQDGRPWRDILSAPGHQVESEREIEHGHSCTLKIDGIEMTLFVSWIPDAELEKRQLVAGTRMPTATTAEILAGKIAERWRGPMGYVPDRDLYDLVVARTVEPGAVKDLFDRLPERTFQRAAERLRAIDRSVPDPRNRPILDPSWNVDMVTLASRLAEALDTCDWERIEKAHEAAPPTRGPTRDEEQERGLDR